MIADIRIKTSFLRHRKRRKLAYLLGVDGTGYVLDLWINTAMNRPDGILTGMDHEDVALDAGWPGDARQFCDALIAVAFIDVLPDGTLALHDWAEHQEWVTGAKARSENARNAVKQRWEKAKKGTAEEAHAEGDGAPAVGKMPEVGSKSGENIRPVFEQNTPSIHGAYDQNTQGNTPLLSLPKDSKKYPPTSAYAEASPRSGGTPYSEAFEAWWAEYPRKVAKGYAWKCWRKIKGVNADVLIAAIRAQRAAPGHWMVGREECIPYPSTWLNKGCWEDEVKTGGSCTAASRLRAKALAAKEEAEHDAP